MKVLWLTWKDKTHPLAGGAETVNEAIAKRLVERGHEVTFLVAGHVGCVHEEMVDGYRVIRVGDRWSVYLHAWLYYKAHLQGWADLVIDEVNTIPFFAGFYTREKTVLFFHQLCRNVWFYEMPFPLSVLGYLMEPLMLFLVNHFPTLTVSESTKTDLMRYGFQEKKIFLIPVGIEIEPVGNLDRQKFAHPTLLSLGSMRRMKRTKDIVRAFEMAKEQIPTLRLILAGDASGAYGKSVLSLVNHSRYRDSVEAKGRVHAHERKELMMRAHVLLSTSVKEGWGLVVTEAQSQGTPAVVYNVDGLRESVVDGQTGIISQRNTPEALAEAVVRIFKDPSVYERLRHNGWKASQAYTFDRSAQIFEDVCCRF